MKPEQLLFAETHEWVCVEEKGGKKIGTVGVTEFAVEQMTDLVFLALPPVGSTVEAGQAFGEIESVKAVSELYSPVSGEVVQVNSDLPNHLDRLSRDPYGAGWFLKVEISDELALSKLLDYEQYQAQCEAEG